jgi:hypothetical protein
MSLELRVEQIGEMHIEPYAELSRSEYGDNAAISRPDHLRWKFLDNPQGPSVGIHLYRENQLAGRMVALTRQFVHKGRIFKAAHIVDFLVHPRERSMNALLQLASGLKKLTNFDFFLVMSPNPAGAAVWEKFVKMRGYFELNVAVAPLRPVALLHATGKIRSDAMAPFLDPPWRLLSEAAFRIAGSFSAVSVETRWPERKDIDRLFEVEWGHQIVGLRTAEFLDWRYRRGPVFRYKVFFLRDKGELCGYFVTRRAAYDGIDCLFVVDAFGRLDVKPSAWRTVSSASIATVGGKSPEMALILGNTDWGPLAAVNQIPYLSVPVRRLPRRTTVYAEWRTEPGFDIRQDNFYIVLGDSDVV